ncbi:DNA polymerase IV [Stackebrandtia nassauensis]|uniref:DNA polymerase IV n=1 Tax=Stackebrandtia nassauensis (strain DSM 44728 / CIP 108903 / NRRL B-16338 / NBRC 102104 / LLR-40K-21) TaxID=446470 RepID=D3Q9L7_STANL|nr:DNA polymerase IV [Stackebrandtia nassauensis]ADD44563.1 DNA-directed DNA polymerase [Stackebrandtia nassauensis DSM 44728]
MGRTTPSAATSDSFGPDLDDTGCPILHVDMDAFFASVEIARRPALRGKPVVVGGLGPRGVVSAASYEARPYGVNSAMPMAVARKRCPHAVFLHPDGREYSRVSKSVMAIFAEYTPLVEKLSVDEAFLDVGGSARLFGSARAIAAEIRTRVHAEHGITCTVGVAATKFIAKLASTQAKPDGLAVVPRDRILGFLHPLPITALWGVGEKTAAVLRRLGLETVADIAHATQRQLESAVGKASSAHLYALANGLDPRSVETTRVDKSVSAEVTFDADVADADELRKTVLRLSRQVAARARKAAVTGRTVAVKIRYSDFTTLSRSRTLIEPTDLAKEVYTVAAELVTANVTRPVRLIGVRLEGLADSGGRGWQPTLDSPEHGWRDVERAIDTLSDRYGSRIVRPASLLEEEVKDR